MVCDCKTEKDAKERLSVLQERLREASQRLSVGKRTLIVVFEGLDAAGKSGCIKRVAKKLEPGQVRVIPIARPTEEEYRYHYMRRFWLTLPAYGQIALYDRSWYGRVLVERVEGFATHDEWSRAYGEINAFERQLRDDGAILVKLWLDVSEEEQFRRFMARKNDPKKAYKLTGEDWRNRAKRPLYDEAAADMFRFTDTAFAPWTILPADSKPLARTAAVEAILAAMERPDARV